MPRPREVLRFDELGLTTPLPPVLARTRAEQQALAAQAKKDKRARIAAATATLAAARDEVQAHKQRVADEHARAREAKAQRKYALDAAHAAAQAQRDADARERAVVAVRATQAMCARVQREERVARASEVAVRAQAARERAAAARPAPASVHVPVHRSAEMAAQRADLPVLREEQPIVEAVNAATRTCVLICGETGSGKTTQIPQFLWEAGYGHDAGAALGREGCVLVTEPRRVAAVAMARRVADELGVGFGNEVCYHVRYDKNVSPSCRLKFATEGIALKEIQGDFLLRKYSAVIVDEAHERSVSCDLLIGLLSRIAPLRNDMFAEQLVACGGDVRATTIKPLRVVIMSATMRVDDFRDNRTLFAHPPPLLCVEARRYPVTNHFARRTELKAYVDAAFAKVRQIHKKLPPGGILVFLCTQHEIEQLCARLRRYYATTRIEYYDDAYHKRSLLTQRDDDGDDDTSSNDDDDDDGDKQTATARDEYGLRASDYDFVTNDDDGDGDVAQRGTRRKRARGRRGDDDDDDNNNRTNDDDDDAAAAREDSEVNGEVDTLHVLPLYALLDVAAQQRVFCAPPRGKRLCVVATNVAETSITIPHIRYVVDAGRVKSKHIDADTGASSYRIEWTSQASAEQRSGRAGRVGAGHCYRLYSTAVFANQMPAHGVPEILRTPLDAVVLLMKHIGIDHVGAFPFPSPPPRADVRTALRHLAALGALDAHAQFRITALGRRLVQYALPPRLARVLVEALQRRMPPAVLDMATAIVAVAATTTTPFTAEGNRLKSMSTTTAAATAMHSGTAPAASTSSSSLVVVGGSEDKRARNNNDDDNDDDEAAAEQRRRAAAVRALVNPGSDLLTYLNAFAAYTREGARACHTRCLVQKSMLEARMLYRQLRAMHARLREHEQQQQQQQQRQATGDSDDDEVVDTLDANEAGALARVEGSSSISNSNDDDHGRQDDGSVVRAASRSEELLLRQVFIAGLIDQVARRATVHECRAHRVDYVSGKTSKVPYLATRTRRIVYVHPSSAVARTTPAPEYVTFAFLQSVSRHVPRQSSDTKDDDDDDDDDSGARRRRQSQQQQQAHTPRTMMLGVTAVTLEWLHQYGYCEADEQQAHTTAAAAADDDDHGARARSNYV